MLPFELRLILRLPPTALLSRSFHHSIQARYIRDDDGCKLFAHRQGPLTVLALESSADDTCCAIIHSPTPKSNTRILSNVVVRQDDLLKEWGGNNPKTAQERHERMMPSTIARALKEAKMNKIAVKSDQTVDATEERLFCGILDVDVVAFTEGPGMYGCLGVSANAAKAIAAVNDKKLIGVHHMQAHALTPFLTEQTPPKFPFLTLLVSGGHTMLVFASDRHQLEVLGETQDESIGASIDKIARTLSMAGGRELEQFASLSTNPPSATEFKSNPFNQIHPFRGEYSFSFSGLRSQFEREYARLVDESESEEAMSEEELQEAKRGLARAFLITAFRMLEDKVLLALEKFSDGLIDDIDTLVVSGGVASNRFLRERYESFFFFFVFLLFVFLLFFLLTGLSII